MPAWPERLVLLGFVPLLFLRDLGTRDLWASHEARAAQHAQCMLEDGDWGLPRLLDDQVDYQKPPAFYWLVAATAATLRGGMVDAWSVRLPSACAGLLTVGLVFFFLRQWGRPTAALIAAIVLATAVHFTGMARTGRIDMSLTAAITAAMLLGWRAAVTRERPSVMRSAGLGITLGVALLLKGPIGFVLPAAALGVLWLTERRGALPWSRLAIALTVMLAVALPWYCWAIATTHGEFARVFFVYHHFNRAFGGAAGLAGHPWWYYAPRFAVDFLPWTPLLVIAIAAMARRSDCKSDLLGRFGLVWFVVMLGVLSCSRFKRSDYLLPAYPGAAIFLGCVAERWLSGLSVRRQRLLLHVATPALLATVLAGWLMFETHVAPRQEAERQQSAFAAAVRIEVPQPGKVLLFRVESHLLAYHLGRPLHTLVEWSELNERLAQPGTHYFVTRAEFVPECLQNVHTRRLEIAAQSETYARVTPLRPLVLMRTIAEPAGPSLYACPTNPPPPKD